MSMTFTKLFSSITESTIWILDNETRIIWITMLAMADKRGRVWGSVPGLANRARVTVEAVEKALGSFLAPDPYSRTQDNEGRRIEVIDGGWHLLNHEKYRAIRDEEAVKESKRNYINERRATERAAKSVEHCRPNADSYSDAAPEAEATPERRRSYDLVLSPEGKESVKDKAKGTKEQCAEYAVEIGLPRTDGEVFFDGQEGKAWKGTKDWRAVMRTWKGHGYMASQKQHTPTLRAQPTAQWEPPSGV